MVNDRMVERVEQGSYRLGMRLIELGNLAKTRVSVREHALPYMRELHAATGEAVNLSVRREDEIVYIERSSSGRAMMRVVNVIGGRAPLHITAVGKLFLLEDGADGLRETCAFPFTHSGTTGWLTDLSWGRFMIAGVLK